MNDLWIAVILGVVEGLTEFLPVSSTGHLIVAGNLLRATGDKIDCFEVFIQLGAIFAVVVLYRSRFIDLIPTKRRNPLGGQGFEGLRGLLMLLVTTFPALVLGFFLHGFIKSYLFKPETVAWALALGGVAILLAERFKPEAIVRDIGELTYRNAFVIGIFQCVSMWPGVSRAAATIIGGLMCGLDRKSATEYSFLAAVPVMIAATSYDLLKTWNLLTADDFLLFAVGFVVSFLTAIVAVETFIKLVQRWSLAPYAYYRIAIAPIIYLLLR
jgi:undecaprenyl-diphosphatase